MWFRRILNVKPGLRGWVGITQRGEQLGKPGRVEISPSARALRQLNRLTLNTDRSLPGYSGGSRTSHRRKPAYDFREHRQYTPGDDVRFVDWRASARQEHVFIKQGEHLKNAIVYLLIDSSASMGWGDPPKALCALKLASALGYLGLAHGDQLIVYPILAPGASAGLKPLGPISGKGQFPGLISYLQAVPFQGQIDLAQGLKNLSQRGRGGLVLILSDLMGVPDLSGALERLPLPGWNVVLLHLLHPEELNPGLRGDFEMQDVETGQKKRYVVTDKAIQKYQERLNAWRDGLEQATQERKAAYSLISTDWSLEGEILPRLRSANVVKPL